MLAKSLLCRNVSARTSVARFASNYFVLGDSSKLQDIIESEGSKVLYFTATWCPPCKKIAPVFEKISKEFEATTFVKIDIDDHRELAEKYNISSVPTFKAFVGTTLTSEVSGSLPTINKQFEFLNDNVYLCFHSSLELMRMLSEERWRAFRRSKRVMRTFGFS